MLMIRRPKAVPRAVMGGSPRWWFQPLVPVVSSTRIASIIEAVVCWKSADRSMRSEGRALRTRRDSGLRACLNRPAERRPSPDQSKALEMSWSTKLSSGRKKFRYSKPLPLATRLLR